MNVLLLALSTFKGDPKSVSVLDESEYKFEAAKLEGNYYYQMEPVVQVLSKLLEKKNQKLDKIVMLCSDETKKSKEIEKNGERESISPLAFFERETRLWLNQDIAEDQQFYPISIDENDPAGGIAKAVKLLRELKQENMNLYLDNHGGFRGIQLTVEAILSLLKAEKIELSDVFNVNYDGKSSVITAKDAGFKMFDFVSGINEFTNYGRIDSLNRYFDGEEIDSSAQNLLSIISGIAESIQLCDVPTFETNLDLLTDFFQNDAHRNFSTNNFLQLFYDNIRNDYSTLLGKDRRNTLDEVEWCLNKGFYQQCLTLIEGKMPIELYENQILGWDQDKEEWAENNRGDFNKYVYFFNSITGGTYLYFNREESGRFRENRKDAPNYLEQKLEELIMNCHSEQEFSETVSSWGQENKIKHLSYKDTNNNCNYNVDFQYNRDSQKLKKMYCFLVLHKALKVIRNKSNHASEINIPLANIKVAIETYIHWGRSILSGFGN